MVIFLFFCDQKEPIDSTKFVAGWDHEYVCGYSESGISIILTNNLHWGLKIGKKYPRNPFGS